jgi:adenosine deaminase
MTVPSIDPLAEVRIDPLVAALPKADLHLHQEAEARLDRILAQREARPPYNWRGWARRLIAETPPGLGRLTGIYEPDAALPLDGAGAGPEEFITRVADTLEEGAADGAVLVEVRFGATRAPSPPDLMPCFREAERRVRERYPALRAEAIGYLGLVSNPEKLSQTERQLEACLEAAREGLAGVDFRVDPYDTEADPSLWETAYRWARRASDAGLGITMHAGEFSTANLAAALRVPGLSRLGHAVYAAADERLLDLLARSGVTVECSLSCNVILGAAPSYEAHPIRRFVERGVPVCLNTDLPVHTGTTIGREYAVAAALGFSPAELLGFTRNAVAASFTSPERKVALLTGLREWEERQMAP